MITLYGFGPAIGVPDASPFVVKTMLLLKFAGLPFRMETGSLRNAPKGKLPYIEDDGRRIADSTLIRFHLEKTYGIDLDIGLAPEARAISWAVEKMCEDHLYWALVDMRWCDDQNFRAGLGQFFASIPAPIRPLATRFIRGLVRRKLKAQGMGVLTKDEIEMLAIRDIGAISAILGERPFLMGELPCAADAAVFAFISALLSKANRSPIRAAAEKSPNLAGYCARMHAAYFGPTEAPHFN